MEHTNIEKIRHSLAHIMAGAVREKFPNMKFGIGPIIENGFYYDFDDVEIKDTDLQKIQKEMKKLIQKNIDFEKEEISVTDAKKMFKDQPYKIELIEDLEKKEGIKTVSIYISNGFVDLCAGPHITNTKEINIDAFKLTKIAGAYWRGDEKNKMLTRIYGVAFETKDELEAYEKMLEEAEKRDHRKLGKEMKLFMISEEVGKRLPLWLPNGAFVRKKLEDYMYKTELESGYSFVYTPVLANKKLYETSGHLAHYKDDMYNPIDIEGEEYYLKPMNCPHHHIMYKNDGKSYRDLPVRLSDFSPIHRFERSGVLTGLIRARCFSQNDSHIYCRKNQIEEELLNVLAMFKKVYLDFGINDYWFRLSLPDFSNKEKFGDIKNEDLWKESADFARNALNKSGEKYTEVAGEAAFYGPKIDVQTKNVLGKEDTIATMQIDFYMPERFNLEFTNDKGEKERPVIIHRAIMGSFDRFFAFLVEKTAGNFPFWLSPVQIKVLPISDAHKEYATEIYKELRNSNFRVELDSNNESLGKKIRKAKMEKIPYLLVIGEKEVEEKTVTVESRDAGNIGAMNLEDLIQKLSEKNK
ncbi:MAG: threonine--tRNA ligase [Candidatus Pacebacteria bacterium]|nr:threonine--tRNA ligase [Candidatus Paceibacterota bacterium]